MTTLNFTIAEQAGLCASAVISTLQGESKASSVFRNWSRFESKEKIRNGEENWVILICSPYSSFNCQIQLR